MMFTFSGILYLMIVINGETMSIWNAVLIIGIRFNANITSNLAYL